jgi:hypothetical protein
MRFHISLIRAGRVLQLIATAALIYHLLILLDVVPYEMVWGGKLKDYDQMLVFEFISIVVNLLLIGSVWAYFQSHPHGYHKTGRILMWLFGVLFAVNTLGNIFAENIWEAIIFTPITAISSFLSFKLALHRSKNKHSQEELY